MKTVAIGIVAIGIVAWTYHSSMFVSAFVPTQSNQCARRSGPGQLSSGPEYSNKVLSIALTPFQWSFWKKDENGDDDDDAARGFATEESPSATKEAQEAMRRTAKMMEDHRRSQEAAERTAAMTEELSAALVVAALSVLTVWSDCLPEYPLVPQESYTDLLRRLPWQAGLLTELCFFQAHGYKQMKRSRKECVKRSGKCTTFCVERFMEGSDQFLQSWTKVFNFLGISRPTPGTPAYDCIRRADLTRPDFTGGKRHVTINKNLIAGVDRKRMEQYVRKEDAVQSMLRLGGQWRSLAFLERRVKC